jgi:hypothetical protein
MKHGDPVHTHEHWRHDSQTDERDRLPDVRDRDGDGHTHGGDHHAHMVARFRSRFWVALTLTLPVLALAPMIQEFLGLREALAFRGDAWVQAIGRGTSAQTRHDDPDRHGDHRVMGL